MSETSLAENSLDLLHQVLESETGEYRKAVAALQRKKVALVSRKPKELIPVDRELMAISRKGKQLETQRQAIMAGLGHPNGRLENLISGLEPADARRFEDVRTRLVRTIQDVARLNQESRSLLDLSMNWIQETVEIITAAISPEGASYDAQGGKKKGAAAPPPIQSTVNHSA